MKSMAMGRSKRVRTLQEIKEDLSQLIASLPKQPNDVQEYELRSSWKLIEETVEELQDHTT
jgi:hypothetical protein